MKVPEIVAGIPSREGSAFKELERRGRGKYEIPKPANGHRKNVRLFLFCPRFKVSPGRGDITVFCMLDGVEPRESELTFGSGSAAPVRAVVTNQPLVAVVVERGQPQVNLFRFEIGRNHHLTWLRMIKLGKGAVGSFPPAIKRYEQVARRAQALLLG